MLLLVKVYSSYKIALTSHKAEDANPHNVTKSQVVLENVDNVKQIPLAEKGQPSGVATLDVSGVIPTSQSGVPKSNYNATSAPTVNDDSSIGYSVGSRWVFFEIEWVCFDASAGKAKWIKTSLAERKYDFYNSGEEFVNLTGGWVQGYTKQPATYSKTSFLQVTAGAAGYGEANFVTSLKIGLSAISTLYVDWECATGAGNTWIEVSNGKEGSYEDYVSRKVNASSFARVQESLDVSALSGAYHLKVGGKTNATSTQSVIKVHKIWGVV